MRCDEFENRLNDLLDARQSPTQDRALAAHAATCGDCREQLSACAALLRGLQAAPPPLPSPQFAQAVVARYQPQSRRPSAQALLLWGGALALSAALLLAVTLALGPRDPANPVVAQPSPTTQQPAVNRPAASHPAPGGLAIGTAQPRVPPAPTIAAPPAAPVASPAPVTLAAYRESLEQLTSQLPSSIPPLETVDQYAPGFRPLRQSFEAAFDALLRTMPGQHEQQPATPPQALWPSAGGSLV